MSDADSHSSTYLTSVRSCYQNYPEAVSYYDRLIDHLKKCSTKPGVALHSALQKVNLFEIDPGSTEAFPSGFPFTPVHWQHRQEKPSVAVLEGYPSPDSVSFLGSRFKNIRPEFFIGNLHGDMKDSSGGLYELPNLVSAQDNLIHIQYASLFRTLLPSSESGSMGRKRSDIENARLTYDKSLASEGRYGATRLRRVNMHDHQVYSTEETVSLTVVMDGASWCVIIITDHGRSLINYQGLPWTRCDANGRPGGTIPLVPYNTPAKSDLDAPYDYVSAQKQQPLASLDQFHPLKNIVLGDHVDRQLIESDPFFLLASLLRTSFQSWAQLLNFLTEAIALSQGELDLAQTRLRHHLEQLRYHVTIINRAKEFLLKSHDLIKQGGCPSWPKANNAETQSRKRFMQQQLEADYSQLMERCSMLTEQCESATTTLVGFAQLLASGRSIDQAAEVNRLTKMAALFIPLSFTASIFGMNLREWNPLPSWKWPFSCAIIFSLATLFWLYRSLLTERGPRIWGKVLESTKRWIM